MVHKNHEQLKAFNQGRKYNSAVSLLVGQTTLIKNQDKESRGLDKVLEITLASVRKAEDSINRGLEMEDEYEGYFNDLSKAIGDFHKAHKDLAYNYAYNNKDFLDAIEGGKNAYI